MSRNNPYRILLLTLLVGLAPVCLHAKDKGGSVPDLTQGKKYKKTKKNLLREIFDLMRGKRVAIKFVYRGTKSAPLDLVDAISGQKGKKCLVLRAHGNGLSGPGRPAVYVVLPGIPAPWKAKLRKVEAGDTLELKCFVGRAARKNYLLVEGLTITP